MAKRMSTRDSSSHLIYKEPQQGSFHPRYLKTKDMEDDVKFVIYVPVPDDGRSQSINDWMARTEYIESQIRYVQSLSHRQFWCQVLFNGSLQTCVTSFLRYVPRYDNPLQNRHSSEDVEDRLYSLRRVFLTLCVKMSKFDEDQSDRIPTDEFGEMIYSNGIFDIPRILDFCTAYVYTDREIVEKVVNNIFEVQPKYQNDLKKLARLLPSVLNSIREKYDFGVRSDRPKRISQSGAESIDNASSRPLKEIVSDVHGAFRPVQVLFEVYRPAAKLFPCEFVLNQLSTFYEAFYEHVRRVVEEREDAPEEIHEAYCLSQHSLLEVFREILFQSTLNCIFDDPERVEEIVDEYLTWLQSVLCEKRFLADYFSYFPIGDDEELIGQSGYKIDDVRFSYIARAVDDAVLAHAIAASDSASGIPSQSDDGDGKSEESDDDEGALGACARDPSVTDELLSKILSIQELLPHLGSGFIRACLEYYDGDVEGVIAAIFEDNLPLHLRELDHNLEIESDRRASPDRASASSHLAMRKNVFDDDEFDAFSRKIDESRVHIGKKRDETNTRLTDESLKQKIKLLNELLSDEDEAAMYDDEYDDSCDVRVIGKVDTFSVDEPTPDEFVVERLNEPLRFREVNNHGEDDSAANGSSKNPASFLEDPAVLRERAAQRRADKFAAKSRNWKKNPLPNCEPDKNGDASNLGAPPRDVKGGPRGRGQSADVVRNRAFKERNKASRVNHNRKDLADKKHKF